MTGDDRPPAPSHEDSRRRLYVEFEVEPDASSSCPLRESDREIVDVRQQQTGGQCRMDLTLAANDCGCDDDDCTEVVHASSNVNSACPCAVFGDYGCVPQVTDVVDDEVVIETFLPDRELLTDLVADLKSVVGGLSLRRLKRVGALDTDGRQTAVTLDLFELTETQRETATAAVAAGYYSRPREASLGELAAELGVSDSALSQRLNAVESKLATAAFAQSRA